MDTKLSVALLASISLFMSGAAFAVADEKSDDYLNWSYAMGEVQEQNGPTRAEKDVVASVEQIVQPTCTEGCPNRMENAQDVMALTVSYENDVIPVADETENFVEYVAEEPSFKPVKSKKQPMAYSTPNAEMPVVNEAYQLDTQVETRYVTTPAEVQYPVTHQYPVSVQYPVTVQRNMTVEHPVIVQQPVIVRRPVVMQQDITVQRQPTVVQNQPVVMNQQPTYVQQQPMYIQAPAQPIPPAMVSQMMQQTVQPVMPQQFLFQQVPVMVQPTPAMVPQQYVFQAQGQAQIQPQIQPQSAYLMPEAVLGQGVVQPATPIQQPIYPNPVQ